MPDIPHDPDLPLAVLSSSGVLRARFFFRPEAERFMRMAGTDSWSIVDTTPKPLIPVDAEVISWRDGAYLPQIAQRNPNDFRPENGYDWWHGDAGKDARWMTEAALLQRVGDAEITVLDPRKEES